MSDQEPADGPPDVIPYSPFLRGLRSPRRLPTFMADLPSVLLASSEVVGFAKTGGLADVSGYLPLALARRGHPVAVVMPLYRSVRTGDRPIRPTEHILGVPLGRTIIPSRLWRSELPESDVPVFLIENADFFERDDPTKGLGIYQRTTPDGRKVDYSDNCARFVFFSRAVMEAAPYVGFPPDILHANDWQTGLIPVYLRELYRHRADYRRMRTLFTIHNIAFQGAFPHELFHLTGLDFRLYNPHQLEFYGQFNLLKGGVVFADWVNTVSPTYANEIRTPTFGCGMEGVLNERRDRLSGIVNGVDYTSWDSATDPHIAQNFTPETVIDGKAVCKADVQRLFGLPVERHIPLLGMVARLTEQKGVDLVIKAADDMFKLPVQLVILGEGDTGYHARLYAMRDQYPKNVGLHVGFAETLAHKIEAGSDLYLMPSLFEPSGLNQLYSLRYGTPPIVRTTGGLADTIIDTTEESLLTREPTGFRFQAYTPQALAGTVRWAVHLYNDRPDTFLRIMRNGMKADWSWDRSAAGYEKIYQRLVNEREGRRLAESA
ncbi:MAG TPA: glycogen synthase GlgA [Gemmataceae bacterium]|nr:glycogen synthase GlgA [Gemmataceae bacterium]